MRLVLICVGKVRPPFADDVAHYERLLGRQARLEVVELPEAGADPARAGRRCERGAGDPEADSRRGLRLRARPEGEQLSSEGLAAFVEERRMAGRICASWSAARWASTARCWSARSARCRSAAITLPHQLARVVLLEQLFRAHKILAGEPYHY